MGLKKHIPNAITSMNLVFGVLGVISVVGDADLQMGAVFLLCASVCDFLDGLAARLLHAQSVIGADLDSLSDMVSFGVLPSMTLLQAMRLSGGNALLSYITIALAVFSALRLAKFNNDPRQQSSFIGLPTTAVAIICASFGYWLQSTGYSGTLARLAGSLWFIPAVTALMCFLLVCEIPMFSIKIGAAQKQTTLLKIKRTAFISISAIMCIVTAVLGLNFSAAVLFVFLSYVLVNVAMCGCRDDVPATEERKKEEGTPTE